MTLIIAAATPSCVYLASDRRVSWIEADGSVSQRDDEQNKAVLWCRRIAFAYTGLAELGPEQRTDLWLAQTLADLESTVATRSQGGLIAGVAQRATFELDRPSLTALEAERRRHAFVGIGWARFRDGDPLEPYRVLVSNFHEAAEDDDNELRELTGATRDFRHGARVLERGAGGFVEIFPTDSYAGDVQRFVAQLAHATDPPADPDLVTSLLVDEVRATADRNPDVGRGVMVTILPRAAVERDSGFLLAGPPEPDQATFLYVPPGRASGVIHGPTTTCGGSVMSGFTAGPPD